MFLKLKPSKLLARLVLAGHVGAVLVTANVALPVGWRTLLILALAISLGAQWRKAARAGGTLRIEPDGGCVLTGVSGTHHGRITGAAVFPLFVRLAVSADGRRARVLLVMRDAVTADGYRALRARIVQRRLPVRATQPPV